MNPGHYLPSDLVGPTRIVSQTLDTVPNVKIAENQNKVLVICRPHLERSDDPPCNLNGLSVVQSFQFSKLLGVAFNQVGKLV